MPMHPVLHGTRQCTALAAMLGVLASTGPALSEIPAELLGKWSTDKVRCEQVNGEVDILYIDRSGFDFYEVSCTLSAPDANGTAYPAQCRKGGSPVTQGRVDFQHTGPDELRMALKGFSWSTEDSTRYYRCSPTGQAG